MSRELFEATRFRNFRKFRIFSPSPKGCHQKPCDSFCKCPFPETGNSMNEQATLTKKDQCEGRKQEGTAILYNVIILI